MIYRLQNKVSILPVVFWMLGLFFIAPSISAHNAEFKKAGKDTTANKMEERAAYFAGLADSVQIFINPSELPSNATTPISSINVRDMDVRDLFRGLGKEFDLNVMVNNSINKKVTVRFSGISVLEAMIHICRANSLLLRQVGQVFKIRNYEPPKPEPVEKIPDITYAENGTITVDLKNNDLRKVIRRLSMLTDKNIVIRHGISGKVSSFLQDIPFETGLKTLLKNNGFTVHERDGIYIVDRIGRPGYQGRESGNLFWINVDSGMISMDVVKAQISDLIREIAFQTDVSMITYQLPKGTITAKTHNLSLKQTLAYLFRGTGVTYRKEGDIYVIGSKSTRGFATTELIRLQHIRADVVMEMLPPHILQNASVQVVKEQNGLLIIGTHAIITELRNFIEEIDYPTPQILIEALVVDVNTSDIFELGATLGYSIEPDEESIFGQGTYSTFGALNSQGEPTGGLIAQGNGTAANSLLALDGNLFGIRNLGVLPPDFYFRIQALDREGKINIRSRPQISTLNGHKASIEIGTTQYYILRTSTPISAPNDVVVQQTERFETIEANVSLEITPWVSASGEVTAEIHPEFNMPVGELSANVPPTIKSRILDSTVRLQDGETIILGGLIQETKQKVFNKIPILGDIPLLGKLFSNRSTKTVKSELIIFITPYVFYGDGYDAERWNELKDELNVEIHN